MSDDREAGGNGGSGSSRSGKRSHASRSALQRGVDLLARREYSRRELRERLHARGHDAQETETALDTLASRQYQSDARYAEMLARSRAAQGYGPRRIRMELSAQGVTRELCEVAMDSLNQDWDQTARALVRRRYGASPNPGDRTRAAQFLLRRGFDAATVRSATRTDVDIADDAED